MDEDLAQLRRDVYDLRQQVYLLGINDERVHGKLAAIERDVARMVTVDRYSTVEKIVYGVVSLILVSFVGALIGLVIAR